MSVPIVAFTDTCSYISANVTLIFYCIHFLVLLICQHSNANEEDAELRDLYDSLFPTLSDSFPDVFNAQLFTFERFAWAAGLLYAFSITVQRGGFEGDEAGEMVCVVPM